MAALLDWYVQQPDPLRRKYKGEQFYVNAPNDLGLITSQVGLEVIYTPVNPLIVPQVGFDVVYSAVNPLTVHQAGFEVIFDFVDPPTATPIIFVVT